MTRKEYKYLNVHWTALDEGWLTRDTAYADTIALIVNARYRKCKIMKRICLGLAVRERVAYTGFCKLTDRRFCE